MPDSARLADVLCRRAARVMPARAARDLERLAQPLGLSLARVVGRPCPSRDARAFHLIKRGSCPDSGNETRITLLPTAREA